MTDWKLRDDAPMQGSSDGFWYDIGNGYVKPDEVLADPDQATAVKAAVDLLDSFELALNKAGLINEF